MIIESPNGSRSTLSGQGFRPKSRTTANTVAQVGAGSQKRSRTAIDWRTNAHSQGLHSAKTPTWTAIHSRSDGGWARKDVFDAAGIDLAAIRTFEALRDAALEVSDKGIAITVAVAMFVIALLLFQLPEMLQLAGRVTAP